MTDSLINSFRKLSGGGNEAVALFLTKAPTGYTESSQISDFLIRQEKTKADAMTFYFECPNTIANAAILAEASLVVFRNYNHALDNEIFDVQKDFQLISTQVIKYPLRPTGESYA